MYTHKKNATDTFLFQDPKPCPSDLTTYQSNCQNRHSLPTRGNNSQLLALSHLTNCIPHSVSQSLPLLSSPCLDNESYQLYYEEKRQLLSSLVVRTQIFLHHSPLSSNLFGQHETQFDNGKNTFTTLWDAYNECWHVGDATTFMLNVG